MTSVAKTIRLSASLRSIAGSKTIQVDVSPDATARDLLLALWESNPDLASHIIDDHGGLKPGIQLLIGGRHLDFLQGLDTPVGDADDFMLIPPLGGG